MADSMATEAPIAVVQALSNRLDSITKLLEPLVSAPLNETVGKLSTLERCQLYVLLSYTLNTTIFSKCRFRQISLKDVFLTSNLSIVYLKTQGENPKEHAVIRELVSLVFNSQSAFSNMY